MARDHSSPWPLLFLLGVVLTIGWFGRGPSSENIHPPVIAETKGGEEPVNEANVEDLGVADMPLIQEVTHDDRGTHTVFRVASGPLRRFIRKVEDTKDGVTTTAILVTYSKGGKVLRQQVGATLFEYRYDLDRRLVEVRKNGQLDQRIEYKDGKISQKTYGDGLVQTYDAVGKRIICKMSNGAIYYQRCADGSAGEW